MNLLFLSTPPGGRCFTLQHMSAADFATDSELQAASKPIAALRTALNEVLFGQNELIELVLCGVLARGHVLL
jgi:MoxR-like ATPase